jgi:GTP-binding protein
LIEGAHEGHGLGIQFLKHVERTKILVHLVDSSEFTGRQAEHDFDVIMDELGNFSEDLASKPMIEVASKIDACQEPARIEAIRAKAESANMEFLAISSVTGAGIEDLRFLLRDRLFTLDTQQAVDGATDHQLLVGVDDTDGDPAA